MNQRYRPASRLRSTSDFSGMRKGRRISHGGIRLVYKMNTLDHSRLGLAVSRKYGNAVQRNRFKRQLRDVFRRQVCQSMHIDVLVIPTVSAADMQHAADDFRQAIARIQQQMKPRARL